MLVVAIFVQGKEDSRGKALKRKNVSNFMLPYDAACGEDSKYKMLIIKSQRTEIHKVKDPSDEGRS